MRAAELSARALRLDLQPAVQPLLPAMSREECLSAFSYSKIDETFHDSPTQLNLLDLFFDQVA